MWYECENGNFARPADVDTTSSRVYIYVRRNFEFIPEHTEGETVIPGHYRWEEMKIPHEIWPAYRDQMQNTANIEYLAMMTDVELEE